METADQEIGTTTTPVTAMDLRFMTPRDFVNSVTQ